MRKIIVGPAVAAALVAGGGVDAAAETEPLSSVEAVTSDTGTTDGNDTLGNDTLGNDTSGNDTTATYGFDRLG